MLLMETIGFVGCGTMGKPMALNLVKAGYTLTTHDLNPQPVEELATAGAAVATSPREAAEKSEVVITMLPSSPNVEEVVCGPEGVLKGAKKGSIIIDMSTIDPIVTRKVATAAAGKGIKMLDAPVTGFPTRAAEGTLTIMAGGDKEIFEQCKDILQVMGEKIYYVGGTGMGEVVKLTNNILAAICGIGVCEGFLFGTKLGADPETLFEVISNGGGNSWWLQNCVPYPGLAPNSPANKDFAPGFKTDLMAKDINLVLSAAEAKNIPLFMCTMLRQLLEASQASGYGQKDWSIVSKVLQRLAGDDT
jgi:3-hydroxyisobutyrate dehydrogenase